jgi:hypothetical protein
MTNFGQRTRSGERIATFGKRPAAGVSYGVATGGTSSSITVGGLAYTLLTFTSSGTLTVTKAGLFDVLLIGGGAGGGNVGSGGSAATGSGGGAGGIMVGSVFLDANTTVTVGAKGLGAANSTSGSLSRLGTTTDDFTATGGIAVAGNNYVAAGNSGVGQRFGQNTAFGGGGASGVAFQSSAGGGGTGGLATSGSGGTGGTGGAGTDISPFITGATALRAGGGGGGGVSVGGTGGSGGGGNGAVATNAGSNATLNGSGGGGGAAAAGNQNRNGGDGSDGIVYVRFKV